MTLSSAFQQLWTSLKFLILNITVEPVYLLYFLSHGFYSITSEELYIDKVCRVNFNYTASLCDNIQQHESEQNKVQKYVAELKTYNVLLQSTPGVIYILFAGPWSDTNGRRALISIPMLGYIINNGVFLINGYYFYELKAEYLLFECIQDFCGGSTLLFLGIYGYLTDISTVETRTLRFAFLDGIWPIAYYSGKFFGTMSKVYLGYLSTFAFGMLFSVLGFFYTVIFVKDSIQIRDERLAKEKKIVSKADKKLGLVGIFDLSHIKGALKSISKQRPSDGRLLLILILLVFEANIFAAYGFWGVMYLYLRKVLKFNMVDFTRFSTVWGLSALIGQYLLLPLYTRIFKWKDSTILMVSVVGCIVDYFVIAFATAEWQLYIGVCFNLTYASITTLCRSIMSKTVEPAEIGKTFAIVGFFQALTPFVSSPLFNFLYKATVETAPNAFCFLIMGLFGTCAAIIPFLHQIMSKRDKESMKIQQQTTTAGEL